VNSMLDSHHLQPYSKRNANHAPEVLTEVDALERGKRRDVLESHVLEVMLFDVLAHALETLRFVYCDIDTAQQIV
jgi:hypothetical protein